MRVNTIALFNKNNALYDGLKHIPSVVLAPDFLEIASPGANETVFYCNQLIERDESVYITKEYWRLRTNLKQAQEQKGVKVILVAFGTLGTLGKKKIKPFVEQLIKVFELNPNWHVILSTAGLNIQPPKLANVNILNFVPQMDALSWVDAMITHGGLTTIKECLQAQVPMLIYPYNYKADAPTNGMRVMRKKMGLNGKMNENCATIAQKLSKVLELKLPSPQLDTDLPYGLLKLLNLDEGFANQK